MSQEIDFIEAYGHISAVIFEEPSGLIEWVPDFPEIYLELIKQITPSGENGALTYIQDLFIIPEFRRRGLASELIEKFLDKHQGTIFLIAGSLETPKNFEIVTFYENFGFELVSEDFEYPLMVRKNT